MSIYVDCPQCHQTFPVIETTAARHVSTVCPRCNAYVTVTLPYPAHPLENQAHTGRPQFRTPEGRYLGEFDPETQTVSIRYRGEDHRFKVG